MSKLRNTLCCFLFFILAACNNSADQTAAEETVADEIKAPRKPNIILVVTDDQGNGDLGMHGNPAISTPNMEQLASESLRFTNFHVDPTCSPTRAALMTGKHSMRAGVWHTIMGRSLMPAEQQTMAELLGEQGYRTAIFGKWHLGDNYPFRPQDQGFDEVLIHGGGGVGQTPDYWGNTQFDDTYFRDGEPESFEGYTTEIWFNEAIKFIRERRDEPFFAYIANNAPHRPWRAPEDYVAPYLEMGLPDDMAHFYAMTTFVDDQLGRLRQELKDLALEDDTILIFMSDNGSALSTTTNYFGDEGFEGFDTRIRQNPDLADWDFNSGLRGFKAEVYEGGHRVPLFIHAPGSDLGPARDIDQLTAHYDLLPTILELVGAEAPADIDGVSLLPVINDEADLQRSIVVTNQRLDIPSLDRPSVVMTDRWRYVVWGEQDIEELFDIQADRGQTTNVLDDHPDIVVEMRSQLTEWWGRATAAGFDRQRIIVGNAAENPARLSAMDWMEAQSTNDVPWNPGFQPPKAENPYARWLGRETEFGALPWYVEVASDGDYEIALYLHDKPAATPVRLNYAVLEINGQTLVSEIQEWTAHAVFDVPLNVGNTEFKGWFTDNPETPGTVVPAFFAYVDLQ